MTMHNLGVSNSGQPPPLDSRPPQIVMSTATTMRHHRLNSNVVDVVYDIR